MALAERPAQVTIDRVCQEEADAKEEVRRELARTGKPLRSSADPLSDDELLAKLRDLGLNVDRAGPERVTRSRPGRATLRLARRDARDTQKGEGSDGQRDPVRDGGHGELR